MTRTGKARPLCGVCTGSSSAKPSCLTWTILAAPSGGCAHLTTRAEACTLGCSSIYKVDILFVGLSETPSGVPAIQQELILSSQYPCQQHCTTQEHCIVILDPNSSSLTKGSQHTLPRTFATNLCAQAGHGQPLHKHHLEGDLCRKSSPALERRIPCFHGVHHHLCGHHLLDSRGAFAHTSFVPAPATYVYA